MAKLENMLAENMRRFKTKNLNEAVLSDTFYIFFESETGYNAMEFSYKMPQSTTLKDPVDKYGSSEPTTDSIVYELLKYDRNQKNTDYKHTNLDDYMALTDNWYVFLQNLAKEGGLPIDYKSFGDFSDGDEWKRNLDSDDDEDGYKKTYSDTIVSKPLQLRNGIQLDVTFIKGRHSKLGTTDIIFKCKVRNSKSLTNQTFN